jgi:hypothetical protein
MLLLRFLILVPRESENWSWRKRRRRRRTHPLWLRRG